MAKVFRSPLKRLCENAMDESDSDCESALKRHKFGTEHLSASNLYGSSPEYLQKKFESSDSETKLIIGNGGSNCITRGVDFLNRSNMPFSMNFENNSPFCENQHTACSSEHHNMQYNTRTVGVELSDQENHLDLKNDRTLMTETTETRLKFSKMLAFPKNSITALQPPPVLSSTQSNSLFPER